MASDLSQGVAADLDRWHRTVEVAQAMRATPPADIDGSPSDPLALYEPLTMTAPVTRRLASILCRPRGDLPECSWYHGTWPYLRILGVAAAPSRHEQFFLSALGRLARSGGWSRVLVSGSADYSMLAHVLRAYRANGGAAEATVVDRCQTPIVLCAWYAQLVAASVSTEVCDILGLSPGEPFDVICTHSFLSQFPTSSRPALIAKWRELLRPDGRVVTTTRINPPGTEDPVTFTPAQADAFSEQVVAEATRCQEVLGEDPGELAAAARRYAGRIVVHPTRSLAEVVGLFEEGGFGIERLHVREVPGPVRGDGSLPGTSQPATYAEVVASRG